MDNDTYIYYDGKAIEWLKTQLLMSESTWFKVMHPFAIPYVTPDPYLEILEGAD
jgi:hypothetical protein